LISKNTKNVGTLVHYYDYNGNPISTTPPSTPIIDPYPVLRFQKYSVYNVRQGELAVENNDTENLGWYYTLAEAVAASEPGDELVFYDKTNEVDTINIPHDLTIRSSYENEESAAVNNSGGVAMKVDDRAGDDCSATWQSATAGSCIIIANGKKVLFTNKDSLDGETKTCGNLTFDGDSKGRVVDNYGTLTMTDGITITGGSTPGDGGGIRNDYVATLNITGGNITNNSAIVGDGIAQLGKFNISGGPKFSGHEDDVLLPTARTSDVDHGINCVITKAGELTSEFSGVKIQLYYTQYNGRNVVESGAAEVKASELEKFTLLNLEEHFEYAYTAEDALYKFDVLELKRGVSSVTVKKTVEGTDKLTDEFEFTATLKNGNTQVAFPAQAANSGITLSDDSLTATFKIKGGEEVTFTDLPEGYTLTVVEKQHKYYECNIEKGTITQVISKEDSEMEFVNTYRVATVKVTKKVTGNLGDRRREFDFKVEFDTTSEDIKLKHGDSKTYTVPYGTEFTVTETGYDDYTVTIDGTAGASKTFTIEGDKEIVVENSLSATINTGVDNNTTGRTITLLSLVVVAAIVGTKFYLENERNKRRCRK